MKFVITGALGHIGSRLIRDIAFYFPGSEIFMIDNLITQRYVSLFNLSPLAKYIFIEGDVRDVDLDEILIGADVVVHLAAITDAASSFDRADEVEKNNFLATIKVAEACIRTHAKLIFISSTSVYGIQSEEVTENCLDENLRPQSPYAETKLKEEKYIEQLCNKNGLEAVICRFGTIFGSSTGMRFHTAVNKFCWQAVMNTPITVWKTAYRQRRPYLDLHDATGAILNIIDKKLFNGEKYNVVTLNATVSEIINVIQQFIPDLEIRFVENKIMNQLSYNVSAKKFTATGFQFSGNLQRGLAETIALLKNSHVIDRGFSKS